MPRPAPRLAPVTTAILFCNRCIGDLFGSEAMSEIWSGKMVGRAAAAEAGGHGGMTIWHAGTVLSGGGPNGKTALLDAERAALDGGTHHCGLIRWDPLAPPGNSRLGHSANVVPLHIRVGVSGVPTGHDVVWS